jgi:carboxyl-terminal processing protease
MVISFTRKWDITLMNSFKQTFAFTFIAAICFTAAFFAGYLVNAAHTNSTDLPILHEAYGILRDNGLKPLPAAPALEYGMARGMTEAYGDPFTRFVEPPQHELETNSLQGKFGGIGVRLGTDSTGNYVLYPFPDGPALKAGVQEGDRLLGVDDLLVTSETPGDTISAAIRGPVGEMVTIKVGRPPDFALVEIKIKRDEIALPTVTWHLDAGEPRLGVIEVNLIGETTPGEIRRSIEDMQGRGAVAYALDLRNNGGGLLKEGINIARLFLQDGVVIEQQYRGQKVESYPVKEVGLFAEIPLVVLINENTASAAEIIAGAIQAHGRGKLIGATTYGKNTIQMVFDLQDGSSLHVTAAQWWIPGLEFPHEGHGLLPDLPVEAGEEGLPDPAIAAAVQELLSIP